MKKRLISLLLAAVMCLSMVACGGDKTPGNGKDPAKDAASKEGVFEIVDLSDMSFLEDATDYYFESLKAIGDTLYMVVGVYLPNGYSQRYITTDFDGTVKTNIVLNEDIWDDPAGDVGVAPLKAASAAILTNDIMLPVETAPADVEVPVEEVETPEEQVWKNLYGFNVLSDGKLAFVEMEDRYNNTTGESSQKYDIVIWDTEGTELTRVNLNEQLPDAEYFYVNTLIESESKTVYVLCGEIIVEVDMQGNMIGAYEPSDNTRDLYMANFYKDGYPVFPIWNEDYTKQTFKAIDIRTGNVIEEVNVPENMSNFNVKDGINSGYDLILTNSTGVYGYNFGDTEPKEIMNYINSNLPAYNISQICFLDSEHFIGLYNDIIEYKSHLANFTKVAPENVPDRQTLTMATYGSDSNVIKRVIDFNKSSDTYKILVKDYSQYSVSGDWMAGYTRLNNDIISGKMPDIIQCNENIDVANYASKGLLANIYELMEKDETINREDYAENVFRAFEMNGKLYELPTMFYIWSVMGKSAIWGAEPGITWDEVAAVSAKYPEASLFGNEMIKENALFSALRFVYRELVDEETGECHFDSDVFKEVLEFANTFPKEINYDDLYSNDDYWLNYQTQYMEDRTLLMQNTIYSIYEAWRYGQQSFAEPVTQVGFPTDEGQGNVISAVTSYAISAKSKAMDGAWEFVKQFISEENQTVPEGENYRYSMWGIPVLKKGIEQQASFITKKPTYEDADGNLIEYDDTIWINDQEIIIEPASQEEAQHWIDFIYSVDKKMTSGYEKAREIISEEVEAYFAGQKRVEDVMSIIQSRMSIFISESR